MKAHELSKVLELQFKELKQIASNLSISINSPNQKLTDEQISLIEEFINKTKNKNENKVNESPSVQEPIKAELIDTELEVIDRESIDKKNIIDEKQKVPESKSFQETKSVEKEQDIVKKEEIKYLEESIKEESIKEVEVEFPITVEKFANTLNINLTELIQKLLSKGHILNKNSFIDFSLAEEIAFEYNILLKSNDKRQKVLFL